MEKLSEVKRIQDSVHGQIKIPTDWCEKIIDSPYFQRLRRIEQNSCRAVFPSARHDRFIHSLGVYHIGTIIAKHIKKECKIPKFKYSILKTYRLACLLHDVGHTPFSHTFEEYFTEKNIRNALAERLKDEEFKSDLQARPNKLSEHELLSAYVAVCVYRDVLLDEEINWVLLVRMIIGLPYIDKKDQRDNSRFENVMIELIHGTIDADGLDYVCRDVWAGGYHNFSIDLQRLIEAILIIKDGDNYRLSFSAKALNEIEGVLNVKNFQYLYVLNHHKVHLEQYYLVEAMKTAAVFHMNNPNRDEALRELCNFDAFVKSDIKLPQLNYLFFRPCDDDFVTLMKQTHEKDTFIDGWFERKFLHKPLWKSKMHFFHCFSEVLYDINIPIEEQKQNNADTYLKKVREKRINAICDTKCKVFVLNALQLKEEDVVQITVPPKIRQINPNEIYVSLGGVIRKFSELSHDSFTVLGDMSVFSYWYVNLDKVQGTNDDNKRQKVIDKIKEYAKTIF